MAGKNATYKPNGKGFAAMAIGPEIRKALHEHAEKGLVYAKAISEEFRDTGNYADSFQVTDATVLDFKSKTGPGPRAVARLENTAGYAAAVEWGYHGNKDTPSTSAHRVLGRTAEYLGGSEE